MKIFNKEIIIRNAREEKRNNDIGPVPPIVPDLSSMLMGIFDAGMGYGTVSPLSQPWGTAGANQYTPISLNRILLSYMYTTFGIVQTVIDQPVEDAARGGITFTTDELDSEDLQLLADTMEECKDIAAIKDAMRWAKLFGGGALIINTDQDPTTPLDMRRIGEDTPVEFIAADRWEMLYSYFMADRVPCPYDYYGQPIHYSRAMRVLGKEAPSFVRHRLQGWGMSEVERLMRDINQYVKETDVIYQLMDEAKIDVWKLQALNSKLSNPNSMNAIKTRLQWANMGKNYHNAIIMDSEDDYDQKQITFSGLAEMMKMVQVCMAAACRMPMTKIFGLSAAGFNSGEDDIENYNAMVESETRAKLREVVMPIAKIRCQQIFGFTPEKLKAVFKPLRILGAVEEENVKTQKFNRRSAMYSQGMYTGREYYQALKLDGLETMDTEVGNGLREPEVPAQPSMDIDIPQKPVKEKQVAS